MLYYQVVVAELVQEELVDAGGGSGERVSVQSGVALLHGECQSAHNPPGHPVRRSPDHLERHKSITKNALAPDFAPKLCTRRVSDCFSACFKTCWGPL